MNNTIFAERLREARTAARMTQAELSKRAGVTAATISAYESSDGTKGKNPSLDNALKLAQALNVSLDWLCGFSVKTEKAPVVEFLKLLVDLDEHTDISFDNVDFADNTAQTILPAARGCIDYDDYYLEQQCSEHYNEKFTYPLFVATFHHYFIQKFVGEWQKMRDLYKSHTIDIDLYNLWLNKQYNEIEIAMNTRMAIIDETTQEGEQNGNDQETE